MARSLTSPLFSDEDFDQIEQEVREAKALKARNTSVTLNTALPVTELKVEKTVTPSSKVDLNSVSIGDTMIEVEGMITKLLNEEGKLEEIPNHPAVKDEIVEVVAPKSQNFTEAPIAMIPEFLKRDRNAISDEGRAQLMDHIARQPRFETPSWKLPYAIIGAAATSFSIYKGTDYSAIIAVLTMLPLIDKNFYKRSR